ncbi:hypothetical protein NBRC116602_28780 [Hyphomicrobiales bacterium 4NK60-0047b]
MISEFYYRDLILTFLTLLIILAIKEKNYNLLGGKKVKQFFFLLILGLSINLSSNSVRAAKFEVVKNSPIITRGLGVEGNLSIKCDIRLIGAILPGDLDRLKTVVSKFPEYSRIGLCLQSEGGIFSVSIKIAQFLLGKHRKPYFESSEAYRSVYTVVESGKKCLSACAIIFMAGHFFEPEANLGYLIRRYLHVNGQLGFHSPFLMVSTTEYTKKTLENAHKTATKSIKNMAKLGEGVSADGNAANPNVMPQSLINEMLSYGDKEFYYIDTVHKANKYHVELVGISKPRKLNRCHYDNICFNFHYKERDNSFLRGSSRSCSKAWRSVRRGSQKLLYGANHGGEGAYYCVLKWSKRKRGRLEYYTELVGRKEKIESYGFLLAPNSFYYSPLTLIKNLAR